MNLDSGLHTAVHSMEPYLKPTLTTSLPPHSHACADVTVTFYSPIPYHIIITTVINVGIIQGKIVK